MAKRTKAWYDGKWLTPTFAVLTFVSLPFREDIRDFIVEDLGLILGDWLLDFLLAAGLFGLAVVLMLKSDRATRASEDLRQQVQQNLADHRTQLRKDLESHRKRLQEDLPAVVDPKLNQITNSVATLQSSVSAIGGRLEVLDSRITALKEEVERSNIKN